MYKQNASSTPVSGELQPDSEITVLNHGGVYCAESTDFDKEVNTGESIFKLAFYFFLLLQNICVTFLGRSNFPSGTCRSEPRKCDFRNKFTEVKYSVISHLHSLRVFTY